MYISPGIHSNSGGYYINYSLAVLAGIIFAQNEVWKKLEDKIYASQKIALKLVVLLLIVLIIITMPYARNVWFSDDTFSVQKIFSTIPAISICMLSFLFIRSEKIEKIMIFIGKHSANMYLLHGINLTFLPNIIYFSRNVIVSYIICFVLTLAESVVLDFILSKSGYKKLFLLN